MSRHQSVRIHRELTAQRRADGTYQDLRSYVHQDGKEFLKGKDVGRRRMEVWTRDRRRCVECKAYVTWEQFEMDHIAKVVMGERRWDNLSNLRTLCRNCHRAKHVQIRFTQQEA